MCSWQARSVEWHDKWIIHYPILSLPMNGVFVHLSAEESESHVVIHLNSGYYRFVGAQMTVRDKCLVIYLL